MSFSVFSRLIALPHSVFALPYALSSLFIARHLNIMEGKDATQSFLPLMLLIIIAVISARSAAMAFNRLLDASIDALNPRTSGREIPKGLVSPSQAQLIVVVSLLVFFLCAYSLGPHCLIVSPFVVAILLGYSWTKRFTCYSHLVLGLALALAPGGAWWVLRPQLEVIPLLLMSAVIFWVTGFDIIYSCQDEAFDKTHNLHSIPARLGTKQALVLAKSSHLLAVLLFFAVGYEAKLGMIYFWGMLLISSFFLFQHLLISVNNLNRVNHAFFTCNGIISIGYFVLVLASLP